MARYGMTPFSFVCLHRKCQRVNYGARNRQNAEHTYAPSFSSRHFLFYLLADKQLVKRTQQKARPQQCQWKDVRLQVLHHFRSVQEIVWLIWFVVHFGHHGCYPSFQNVGKGGHFPDFGAKGFLYLHVEFTTR